MDACCPVRYRNALTLAIRKGWDYSTAAAHPRPESFARAWRRSRAELAHSGRSEPAGGCQRCWDLIATRRMLFSKSVICCEFAVSLTQEWLAAAPRRYAREVFCCSSAVPAQLHARRRRHCTRRRLSRPPNHLASLVSRAQLVNCGPPVGERGRARLARSKGERRRALAAALRAVAPAVCQLRQYLLWLPRAPPRKSPNP